MRQRKKATMYALVESWKKSGQSKTTFSQGQGIKLHTFVYWVNKYETDQTLKEVSKSEGTFIPLSIEQPLERGKIEITYPNGVRLSLNGSVSSNYLMELINLPTHV